MRDKDITQGLADAIQESTPDVLVNILSSCSSRPEKHSNSAPASVPAALKALKPARRKRNAGIKPFLAVAAALILIVSGFFVYDNAKADTIIELDVNPSIALNATRKGKVLSATAGNAEGEQVLKDMNLKGTDLNVAMNALLGSMIRNGFVTEAKNAILVSIENKNDKRSSELKASLLGDVYAALEENSIRGSVLCQIVADDSRLKTLAQENGISLGKAALVDILVKQDSTLDFAELSKLSINDLSLLIETKDIAPKEMAVSGYASKEVYISENAVKEIVLDHANVTAAAVGDNYRCKLDWDDGRMVYEVDFFTESTEYDYELDALTGKIINFESEANDNRIPNSSNGSGQTSGTSANSTKAPGANADTGKYIGSAKAKEIALKHAGIAAADANWLRVELERDDGKWEYQVEFWVGNEEYDYEIDALTGKILEYDRDIENYTLNKESTTKVPAGDKIGEVKAKEIAFAHAKIAAANAEHLRVKLARDDGRWEYQVEFWVGSVEYDYEIDAYSGKILDWDRDVEYKAPGTTKPTAPTAVAGKPIGEAKAKEIALKHAGVAAVDARKLEIETDRENGKLVYQIEFKAGNMEYDYEIDAYSGKILDWDKERAD